jgi:hypothetical protein
MSDERTEVREGVQRYSNEGRGTGQSDEGRRKSLQKCFIIVEYREGIQGKRYEG